MYELDTKNSDEEFSVESESEEEKRQDRLALKQLVKDASGDEIESVSDSESESNEDSDDDSSTRKRGNHC